MSDYNNRIENLVYKPLIEFNQDDTIYISKLESGFQIIYFCQFVELKRGIVNAKVISCSPPYGKLNPGDNISARPSKCFLWGAKTGDTFHGIPWKKCIWFKSTKEIAGAY